MAAKKWKLTEFDKLTNGSLRDVGFIITRCYSVSMFIIQFILSVFLMMLREKTQIFKVAGALFPGQTD